MSTKHAQEALQVSPKLIAAFHTPRTRHATNERGRNIFAEQVRAVLAIRYSLYILPEYGVVV